MRHSNLVPEVNAGSMADIAFLLLIFFLVTATISNDEGINRMLPQECPIETDCSYEINERNILKIVINNNDEIMVDGKLAELTEVKDFIKNFLDNNADGSCNYCNGQKIANSSDNPTEAIMSLQNGQQTSYKQYISVQNELTKAYYELRTKYSMEVIGKSFDDLSKLELKKVKDAYPFKLIEAETK